MLETSRADGVNGCERPAGEVAHRLGGVDVLGAGGLVDGERVAPEGLGLLANVREFGFERAAAVAEDYGAVALEAYKLVD
jgi:hypothetical protein